MKVSLPIVEVYTFPNYCILLQFHQASAFLHTLAAKTE